MNDGNDLFDDRVFRGLRETSLLKCEVERYCLKE